MSGRRTVVVERTYVPEAEACTRALNLLLARNLQRKKAARPGGPDDVRKVKDAHTATQHYTG